MLAINIININTGRPWRTAEGPGRVAILQLVAHGLSALSVMDGKARSGALNGLLLGGVGRPFRRDAGGGFAQQPATYARPRTLTLEIRGVAEGKIAFAITEGQRAA